MRSSRAAIPRVGLALVVAITLANVQTSEALARTSSIATRQRADALITKGAQLYLQKRYSEALKICREATEIEPRYARAYVGLGTTYAALKQREAAGRAFRLALTLGIKGKDAERARAGLQKLGLTAQGPKARVTRTSFGPQRGALLPAAFTVRTSLSVSPGGEISTITDAIRKAAPYTRIEVESGTYRESLVINKPLQIVGVGDGRVVIESVNKPVLVLRSPNVELRNLSMHGHCSRGSAEPFPCSGSRGKQSDAAQLHHYFGVTRGRSRFMAQGVTAILRNCLIKGARTSGVLVYDEAKADLVNCAVSGAGYTGIEAMEWGDVLVRSSTLSENRSAVVVQKRGRVLLQDSQVNSNSWEGVKVQEGGVLVLQRTTPRDNPRDLSTERGGIVRRLAIVFAGR
jgi:hypothetical protein